jgi:hypothetical protein
MTRRFAAPQQTAEMLRRSASGRRGAVADDAPADPVLPGVEGHHAQGTPILAGEESGDGRSRRKIAKEKSENSDAMRTLEGCC